MGDSAGDAYALVPVKSNYLSDVDYLKKERTGYPWRFPDDARSRRKTDRLRQFNDDFQNEIDADKAHNEHLLRKIEVLNEAVVNVPGMQDISQLGEDFDIFSEEKRNLEEGVVNLQQQLPFLLSQEQKLGCLLRDQQQALQNLEQKIEEVKFLEEAYACDFQNLIKDETQSETPASTVHDSQKEHTGGIAHTHASTGTWDYFQTPPGKRHRSA